MEPPNPLVQVVAQELPNGINENNLNQLHPSNPNTPETPTPPHHSAVINGTRLLEPATLPNKPPTTHRHAQTTGTQHRLNDAKLYEDNCILAQAVNTLNERLAYMNAPQNAQLHYFAELQEKLRASEASRAAIHKNYQELLHPTSPDSPRRLLFGELQFAQTAYTRLQRDYRILADKYYRLKAQVAGETSRIVQQQPLGASPPVPTVNTTQVRAYDQNRNSYAPLTPATSGSFQHFVDQHQGRSSESAMVQSPLRSGPTPIATTWMPPLPTPPPSASLGGQVLQQGVPVHAQIPARSLPLPHHAQVTHNPRVAPGVPGVPVVAPPQHLRQQGPPEPSIAAMLRQRCGDLTYTTNNGSGTFNRQPPTPMLLPPSPRPPKRPSSELSIQTPVIQVVEHHKKSRVEAEADHPATTMSVDTHPADKLPSPPTSTESHNDCNVSVPTSNLRSYEDCVYTIFEKDANVESGIFCGLCLGRYEREPDKLEPPDVLIAPDFSYLVKHCITEHPTAWDDLRNYRS